MKSSLTRLLSPARLFFFVGVFVAPSLGAAPPQGVGGHAPAPGLPSMAVSGDSSALDRHQKLHYTQNGDQTWVRGRTFKASLSAEGFTYIPFLGSSAPQNYPIRFRLVSATLAGEALPLSDEAAVTRRGDRFVLDRGSVDVIYDVSLEHVEQSFSLDASGVDGDLVLELAVESELVGRPAGDGLAFRGERGGIDYGAAIVLDGAGRRADVPLRLSGERLELTVPATFLLSATGPVVVDPFISTYVVDDYDSTMDNVDISFDATFSQATYVWEDYFSLADVDVYSRTLDAVTNTVISGTYVDSSTDSWIHPRIANLARVDLGLVVAQRVDAATGVHSIVGCYFVESDRIFGPPQTLATPPDGIRYGRPDLGGDNNVNATDPRFMLGWEESNVLGQPTGVSIRYVRPSGYYGPIRSLTGAGVGWHVAISKGNSSRAGLDNWNVVYGFAPTWQGTSYVAYAQLDIQGVPAISGTVHTSQPGSLPYDLDVSESIVAGGFAPKHLISFTETNPASVSAKRMILHNGTSVLKDFDLHEMEHRVSGPRAFGTRVATTWHTAAPPEFIVAYHEELPGGQSGVFVTNLDSYGNRALAISEVATFAGASTPWDPSNGSVALTSMASGGAESQLSLLAWTRPNPTTGVLDIAGATHDAVFPAAVGQQFCTGTLNSSARKGFLAAYGDSSVTGSKLLFASYLPPGSVGFFLAGMGDTSVPFPGGSVGTLCLGGGAVGRYSDSAAISNPNGAIVLTIDPAAISTANGTTAATVGQRWNFQLWHRDSVGGLAVSNFTNAVSIDFL